SGRVGRRRYVRNPLWNGASASLSNVGHDGLKRVLHGSLVYPLCTRQDRDMARTIPTGRTAHELLEVAPTRCPNGPRLGPRQVVVGYGTGPDGLTPRWWMCRACGVITWDEDAR